jgi:phage/plasmid primase-like uncharacterized protein
MCGGKDRFRFADRDVGLWYCRGCGKGDGFSLAMAYKGLDFASAAREIEAVIGGPANDRQGRAWEPCCMECVGDCVKGDRCGRLKKAGLR